MSKFITLLSNTIEKWGYIPSTEDQYETTELIVSFNADEDMEVLFEIIKSQRQEMGVGSIIRLVQRLVNEGKITDKTRIITWILEIFFLEDNHEYLDKYLIHIFFNINSKPADLEEFVERANHKKGLHYEGLETLLIETTAHIKNDSIFRDVYTNALNVDSGNYGGVGFYDEPYVRMAKSTELKKFIETLLSAEYTQAFDTFLGGWPESVQKFFVNIPTTLENQAIIANLITYDPTGSHDRLLGTYKGFDTKVILTHAFDFLSKCGSILNILEPYISSDYGFYTVREYMSAHIRGEEIIPLKHILGTRHINNIVTLYEDINTIEKRENKDIILAAIEALPEFADAKESTKLGREQYHIEEQKISAIQNQEIKRDINDAMSVTVAHDEINRWVIDLYLKHKIQFTNEQKDVVREHIERFFRWNLFPIESIICNQISDNNGSTRYSYSGNIWYIHGFFLDSLEIAQELGITLPSHDILIRSLACMWIDQRVRKQIFPLISSLTEQDVKIIASVYDGSRTDDLALSLGGQNFFALYNQYEDDFRSEIGSLRRILYALIDHQNVDVWTKKRAIEILTHTNIWNEEIDLPIIQNLWIDLSHQNPGNLVEHYHRGFDYVLCVNQVLIDLGIDEAVQWRFDQLLSARINMPDPWKNHSGKFARTISDIEDEITHEKSIISGLTSINLKKWEQQILGLISYSIELIEANQSIYQLYASYLVDGILRIILKKGDVNTIVYFRKRIEILLGKYYGKARQFGNQKFGGFQREVDHQSSTNIPVTHGTIDKNEIKSQYFIKVEGESDQIHLTNAWKNLYPGINAPFVIENGRCASEIKKAFEEFSYGENELLICIGDFDKDGIQLFLQNRGLYECNLAKQCGVCGHAYRANDPNKHFIIIPVMSYELEKQVWTENKKPVTERSNLPMDSLFNNKKPEYVMEHMFYFDGESEWNDRFFPEEVKSKTPIRGLSKNDIGSNTDSQKVSFANNIERIAYDEFHIQPTELYKNFKPIFEKILTIITDSEKNHHKTPIIPRCS